MPALTVYFAYDSDKLNQETRDTLSQNANWIQTNQITSVELEGHCDIRGSEAYNIGLGTRRAQSVKDFLVEQGIDSSKLSVISYGEERPISEFAHDRNRRVNFVPVY